MGRRLPSWLNPTEGVFLAADARERTRRGLHWYGVGLFEDAARLDGVRALWTREAEANDKFFLAECVGGWGRRRADLAKHLARVLTYTLRPWPERHGWRDLDEHIVASGAPAAIWAGIRPLLGVQGQPDRERGAYPSKGLMKASVCARCSEQMPTALKAHAKWCGANCRKRAHEERRRAPVSSPTT